MQKKEVLHKIYKSPVQDFFLGLSFVGVFNISARFFTLFINKWVESEVMSDFFCYFAVELMHTLQTLSLITIRLDR